MKICAECGKEFDPGVHKVSTKYCSYECYRKQKARLAKELYWRKKAEAAEQEKHEEVKPPHVKTDWDAIARKCDETGMSYGMLVVKGII